MTMSSKRAAAKAWLGRSRAVVSTLAGAAMTGLAVVVVSVAVTAAASLSPVASAAEAPGYTGAGALFHIGAGARPLGLGGAFAAVSDDENALFSNPAGLAGLGRVGLTSLYSTQYDVVSYGALAAAGRGFGLGVLYLDSSGIPGAGTDSAILDSFSFGNVAGLAGSALRVGPVAVGVRAKYLSVKSATLESTAAGEGIRDVQGSGFDADVGALLDLGVLRLGLVYENLLTQPVRYDTGSAEALERRLTLGASARVGPVLVAAEVADVTGSRRAYHAGAEVGIGVLALRAGVNGPLPSGRAGDISPDLSAGAGLRLGALQLDYAYLMPSTLPDTHRVSLTLRF